MLDGFERLRVGCGSPARRCSAHESSLNLLVEDEDKSTTGASENVGEGALEESSGTFVGEDLLEAVHGAVVHLLGSARVHHESTSHGIERVGDDTGGNGDNLSEGPHHEDVSVLGIREHDGLTSIEHAEVRGAVGNDSDDGDSEASVETLSTVLGENLLEAVDETTELTLAT